MHVCMYIYIDEKMAWISRSLFIFGKNCSLSQSRRTITVTPVFKIKEIIERKEDKTLIIEGKILPDSHKGPLIESSNGACRLCAVGVDVKHTDVLILRQFLRTDGCLLPRRLTGLCKIQQKRVGIMVTMAQKAGLMPNFSPHNSKNYRKLKFSEKSFNVYYDEDTIEHRYNGILYRQ